MPATRLDSGSYESAPSSVKTAPQACFCLTDTVQNSACTLRSPLCRQESCTERNLSDHCSTREDSPDPVGRILHRQGSGPDEPHRPTAPIFSELKGILKRSQSGQSESGTDQPDSDYASASPSPSFDFWYEFRSVDDVFSDSSDDRKHVSFSEKIMRNTYRPGTCILQQKQRAQKKREKRRAKDGRRTASESDASDMSEVTENFGSLTMRTYDSEGGQGVDILEELVEVDEEQTREQATANSTKKRKHRKNWKARPRSESS